MGSGEKIDARTEWGDLPIHYAAVWGTHQVMEYLFEEGSPVDKPMDICFSKFFQEQNINEELATIYSYSLLQKGARSTCILKNTLIIDRVMKARAKYACNMYSNQRDLDDEVKEMNQQEIQLLSFAEELRDATTSNCGTTTFEMYLKFCPDVLTHILNLCVVPVIPEQVCISLMFTC